MSTNPKIKAKFASKFQMLPASIRDNKAVIGGALTLLAVGAAWYMIRNQNEALTASYAAQGK